MTNEQEIFALMQMAKDQQAAVEQAVAGLDERRRELRAVIEHRLQGMDQQQASQKPGKVGHSATSRKFMPRPQAQAPQEHP